MAQDDLISVGTRSASENEDLIGKKFGRLTVIGIGATIFYANKKKPYRTVICLCDCGQTIEARKNKVVSGEKISCGCRLRLNGAYDKPDAKESSIRSLFYIYKKSAKERLLEFLFLIDLFIELISSNCHYCGKKPDRRFNSFFDKNGLSSDKRRRNSTPTQFQNSAWILVNGIDRIDNSLGYTTENVVSCCMDCNFAKGSKSYEEFMEWLNRIVMFRKENV